MCRLQLLAALFDALVAPDTCALAGECLAGLLASTCPRDTALDDGAGSVHSDASGGVPGAHEADARSKRGGGGGGGRKTQHKAAADRDRLHHQHQQVRGSCGDDAKHEAVPLPERKLAGVACAGVARGVHCFV